MEIITLLKSNIKKKKSTFISIMVLTVIVVTCMVTIFSVRDNYNTAFESALQEGDCADVIGFAATKSVTKEIREKLENHKFVERVKYQECLVTMKVATGDEVEENSYFAMEMRDGIPLLNEKATGYESEIPKLKSGEIYLPHGLASKFSIQVGDRMEVEFKCDVKKEFLIKGFVQEPSMGSSQMGWKQIFISGEDYSAIYKELTQKKTEEEEIDSIMFSIYKSKDCGLPIPQFQRKLNLDTKIVDVSYGALNKEQTKNYTTLIPKVVLDIVLVFIVFLFVIILIVISHSISTEIEIDYVTLGVLKAQGFTKDKIRVIMLLQYLFAQGIGTVIGIGLAIPIERVLSNICQSIVGVVPDRGLSMGKSLLGVLIILFVSTVVILVKTRKIALISPVRAIAGGQEEIFFDSRLQAPIGKRALLVCLSLRQFTSAKRRYAGVVCIAALLTFCMITVNLTGNILSSQDAQAAMGIDVADIYVFWHGSEQDSAWEEVDEIVEQHSEILEVNSQLNLYASLDGENLLCQLDENEQCLKGVLKGRAPLYDNEIIITEMVADTLNKEIGDEVTVSYRESEASYIISGLFQTISDTGMTFAMNFKAAERLKINTDAAYRYYRVEDKTRIKEIGEGIRNVYGDNVEVEIYEDKNNSAFAQYNQIVNALKILIYVFSILFVFVAVQMVCKKMFIQERRDIGIYKAMGFTSRKLQLSFAIRFLVLGFLGSILGALLSVIFSAELLGAALYIVGLAKIIVSYTMLTVLVPAVVVTASFFLFAYFASRKIRKVAVRELVVE